MPGATTARLVVLVFAKLGLRWLLRLAVRVRATCRRSISSPTSSLSAASRSAASPARRLRPGIRRIRKSATSVSPVSTASAVAGPHTAASVPARAGPPTSAALKLAASIEFAGTGGAIERQINAIYAELTAGLEVASLRPSDEVMRHELESLIARVDDFNSFDQLVQARMIERLSQARELRIEADGTDLRLSVAGRCRSDEDWAGVTPSTSAITFPDGEVRIKVKVTAGIERALLALDVRLQSGNWYRLTWLPASGSAYLATHPQGRESILARRDDLSITEPYG